jgi:hypothetical protein
MTKLEEKVLKTKAFIDVLTKIKQNFKNWITKARKN